MSQMLNITEWDQYITQDGCLYNLHAPFIRWTRGLQGTGMPPIEYLTERGPFQDGESIKGYRLRPRVVQMIIRHNYNDRNQLWHGRLQMLDVLRPNRNPLCALEPGVLRKNFPDGRKLDLDVLIQQGPEFGPQPSDTWDEYSFDEVIRFIAHNPVFYDPRLLAHDFISVAVGGIEDPTLTQLVFPIHFPIIFNRHIGSSIEETEIEIRTIHYEGTWKEYPKIVLHGPLDSPFVIENTTTSERLRLNYALEPGEIVTFNLTYGSKSISTNKTSGLSLMGFLDPLSDIGSFHMEPGDNVFNVIITGQDADSTVQIQYHNRYIGY